MFSTVELDYLKGLINSYFMKGYKYYVAHTVTESNNDYDIYIYISKEKITASNSNTFILPEGTLFIKIDSSYRSDGYNPSLNSRDVLSFYENSISIDVAEFIYTNAELNYSLTTDVINPDLFFVGATSVFDLNTSYALLFVCVITFLYTFIKSILRLRR